MGLMSVGHVAGALAGRRKVLGPAVLALLVLLFVWGLVPRTRALDASKMCPVHCELATFERLQVGLCNGVVYAVYMHKHEGTVHRMYYRD